MLGAAAPCGRHSPALLPAARTAAAAGQLRCRLVGERAELSPLTCGVYPKSRLAAAQEKVRLEAVRVTRKGVKSDCGVVRAGVGRARAGVGRSSA